MGPGVSKESKKSPKRVRKSGFGLFSDSFETPGRSFGTLGVPPRGALSGLFSDSFGVPGPKGPGDPVPGRADPKAITSSAGTEEVVITIKGVFSLGRNP